MEYKEDIEQLFKDSFENFESDVHPEAWANIQHSLNVQDISNVPGSNGASVGTKAIVAGSKFGASYIIGAVAVVSLTAGIIYFSSKENIAEKQVPIINEIQNPVNTLANSNVNSVHRNDNPDNKDKKELANPIINSDAKKNTSTQPLNISAPAKQTDASTSDYKASVTEKYDSDSKPADADTKQVQSQSSVSPEIKTDENSSVQEESENTESSQTLQESKESASDKLDEYFLGNITNAITPNADGKNDAFIIDGKKLKSLQVTIQDRSGKIIHQWNNLHGFWDGRLSNGQPAEAGTYFYNIFATTENDKILTRKNSLTLIR